MPTYKFEMQPYYSTAVYDTRVTELFCGEVPQEEPYDFTQQETPFQEQRHKTPLRSTNTVNGLTAIKSGGRDGELAAGGVEILRVDRPDGTALGAINSVLSSTDTGMPIPDGNWACEFEDLDVLKLFRKEYWENMSFERDDVQEAIDRLIDDHPGVEGTIVTYSTGMLKPWFHREPGDRPLLDHFATDGSEMSQTMTRLEKYRDETFDIGRVYKDPIFEPYTTKVSRYAARTCLGAFRIPQPRGLHWSYSDEYHVPLFVQWDNGELTRYSGRLVDQDDAPLPTPLEPKDIAKTPSR